MKFKEGDRIPYLDDGLLSGKIMEQINIDEALKKYDSKQICNYDERPGTDEVVIYGVDGKFEGWDWADSLVPAEIFYSPLYKALE